MRKLIAMILTAAMLCSMLPAQVVADAVEDMGGSRRTEMEAAESHVAFSTTMGFENQWADADASDIRPQEEPQLDLSGTVSGVVTDETGSGVPGVHITIYDMTNATMLVDLVTDGNGAWSCSDVIIGNSYQVWYFHSSYSFERQSQYLLINGQSIAADTITATAKAAIPQTTAGLFTYEPLNGSYCQIIGYSGSDADICIPAEIDGYIVQSIGTHAFRYSAVRTVVLPETIEQICPEAFWEASELEEVRLNHGLGEIGNYAFIGCTRLKTVSIPATVGYLGNSVFYQCAALQEFQIPEGVRGIGAYAFSGTGLTSIEFPNSVTSIAADAFYNCQKLEQVSLPRSFWVQGTDSPFRGCEVLRTVIMREGMTYLPDYVFEDLTGLESVELPGSLEQIGIRAFYNCIGLERIELPANVTNIDKQAFESCKGLTELLLPEGLTTIGSKAFHLCTNLTSLTLPDSVQTMGINVFMGCSKLRELTCPRSWTTCSDGGSPFSGSALESLVVPEGVEAIPDEAFEGCTSLKTVSLPNSLRRIGTHAFSGCSGLVELTLPEGLQTIADYAFSSCTGLAGMELPDTVTAVGRGAFLSCSSMTGIRFSANMTVLKESMLSGCSVLTEVVLPPQLQTIESEAFRNCKQLVSICLPDSVREMGQKLFSGCSNLRSVNYPRSWSGILSQNSPYCEAPLKTLPIPEGVTSIPSKAFYSWETLETLVLPDSVTTIGNNAFTYSGLREIWIGENVTNIAQYAFSSLTELTVHGVEGSYAHEYALSRGFAFSTEPLAQNVPGQLRGLVVDELGAPVSGVSVVLYDLDTNSRADCVQTDADGAWSSSGGIIGHTYQLWFEHTDYQADSPARYQTLEAAVADVPAVTMERREEIPETDASAFAYTVLNGQYCKITRYSGTDVRVRVPAQIDGYQVQRIGASAFKDDTAVEIVILPAGVEAVEDRAFCGCTALRTVVLNPGLGSLAYRAFEGCTVLEQITLPAGITEVDEYVFSGCTSLRRVDLPEGIRIIERYAFRGCTNLESVRLPDSVCTTYGYSFDGCVSLTQMNYPRHWETASSPSIFAGTALKSITVPDTVSKLCENAFSGCDTLESVSLPDGLMEIGRAAFSKCSSLKEIQIPQGVTMIGSSAFSGCSSLKEVVLPETLTVIREAMLAKCSALEHIFIPARVETIEESAFAQCSSLVQVDLPEGLKTIERKAFADCTALTDIFIPNGVHTMGMGVFSGCSSLRQINYPTALANVDTSGSPYMDLPLTMLTVPEGVVEIPADAFYKWSQLESIVLPDSLERIGESAFNMCTALGSISIPEGVTVIEPYTFLGCKRLEQVDLPGNLTQIRGRAFASCTGLRSISIPDSVQSMEEMIFVGCEALLEIRCPLGWRETSDAVSPFSGSSLRTITVPEGVTALPENAFYGCDTVEQILLPESLTSIGSDAFRNCTSLKEIELPGQVEQLGEYVFYGCTGLRGIALPEQLTAISTGTFRGCTGLREFRVPEHVESIGEAAFYGCTGLTGISLPDGVKTIESSAFEKCSNLAQVLLPQGLEIIRVSAFRDCISLKSIHIPDTVHTFETHSFYGCTTLEEINHPLSWENAYGSPYYNCPMLKTVCIPEGVTVIDGQRFAYCTSLEMIQLPNSVTRIGDMTFYGCTGLEKIWIGEGVAQIGEYVFNQAAKLTIHGVAGSYAQKYAEENGIPFSTEFIGEVLGQLSGRVTDELGSGLAGIHVTLFDQTTGETMADLVTDESGCWSFGGAQLGHVCEVWYYHTEYQFDGPVQRYTISAAPVQAETVKATGLGTVSEASESDFSYRVLNGSYCEITQYLGTDRVVRIPLQIDGYLVQSIGSYAFYQMDTLQRVILSEEIQMIGEYAFYRCEALTEVGLNHGLREIGSKAFCRCTALEQIRLPGTVLELKDNAFDNCTSLARVELPGALQTIRSQAFAYCTSLSSIRLPDGLRTMDTGVFYGCSNLVQANYPVHLESVGSDGSPFQGSGLKNATVPEGTEKIADFAFKGCSKLETVVLPETVTSIGAQAFVNCTALKTLVLSPSLTELKYKAFGSCTALKRVELPEGLRSIANEAFTGCSSLQEIRLPDSVQVMGRAVFRDCTSLTELNYPAGWVTADEKGSPYCGSSVVSITIPEGVTAIPDFAFLDWETLQTAKLPESLTKIGTRAFRGCTALREIQLPEGLTELGEFAFGQCISLRSLVITDGLQVISTKAFESCSGLREVIIGTGVREIQESAFKSCSALENVLFPDGLQSIGEEAFEYCDHLRSLALPEGLTMIGESAFSGCDRLRQLYIPDSVCELNYWSLSDFPGEIVCGRYSFVATKCIDWELPAVLVEGNEDEEHLSVLRKDTFYEIDGNGISITGHLPMVLHYRFREDASVTDTVVKVQIPRGMELVEQTLMVDGNLSTDYSYEDGLLQVPVGGTAGWIRFVLDPASFQQVRTYAIVVFRENGVQKTNVLGIIDMMLPVLSISAVSQTATAEVAVNGVSMPGSTVVLSVDGVQQVTVTANKSGQYAASVKLEPLAEGKRYTIAAAAWYGGIQLAAAQTTVTYREKAPTLVDFRMEYNGVEYDILALTEAGISPSITIPSYAKPYRFVVQFDNSEAVDQVFVVSTRSNIRKNITTVWDEAAECFVAYGYFDDATPHYMPGSISVEYTSRTGRRVFSEGIDFTSAEAQSKIPEEWDQAEVIVHEETEERTDITIGGANDSTSVRVTVEKVSIPARVNRENAEEHGYVLVADDEGNTAYVRFNEESDKTTMEIIEEFSDETMLSLGLSEMIAEGVPVVDVVEYADTIMDGFDTSRKYARMIANVRASDLSEEKKSQAIEKLENAQMVNAYLTTLEASAAFVSISASVLLPTLTTICPMFSLAVLAGGIVMGGLFKAIDTGMMISMELMMQELFSFKAKWKVDPSGIVYHQVTGQPLEGATVTAYWLPYDENDGSYWDWTPPEDTYGIPWNAMEYSQDNPLRTDSTGYYAWDVPEGWWRVKCEKEGYVTAWSDWVPVPPPQMHVDIGMMPVSVEEVASGWSGAVRWTLTEDGTLTIYGQGNMKNYGYGGGQPWLDKGVDITAVVIQEGITSVGSGAFRNLSTLESVTFPESTLTRMGEAAFYGSGLKKVEIPASLWTIQPYTFKNCVELTEVILPEGNLMKISDGAFYGCTGLTELQLPDCLDILDVYAFKNCTGLISIAIGSGLTELREAVFYGTGIPAIEIPEGITKIGPYAFKSCASLKTVDLPGSLTSVGEASFYACTGLKRVSFPDAVRTIGSYAFRRCTALETLTFGDELETIGECAFYGCTGLTELVIPGRVTTINPYAFKTCTGLTSVVLGEGVRTIGEGAFNTCTGLKTMAFPAGVETIGGYCFSGSYNIWKLTFQGDAPAIGIGAFKGLNATAYYPNGNATWTAAVIQNYGGKIAWKANY